MRVAPRGMTVCRHHQPVTKVRVLAVVIVAISRALGLPVTAAAQRGAPAAGLIGGEIMRGTPSMMGQATSFSLRVCMVRPPCARRAAQSPRI